VGLLSRRDGPESRKGRGATRGKARTDRRFEWGLTCRAARGERSRLALRPIPENNARHPRDGLAQGVEGFRAAPPPNEGARGGSSSDLDSDDGTSRQEVSCTRLGLRMRQSPVCYGEGTREDHGAAKRVERPKVVSEQRSPRLPSTRGTATPAGRNPDKRREDDSSPHTSDSVYVFLQMHQRYYVR